jgi:hypothetical protein
MNIEENLNFIIGKKLIQIRMNLYLIDLIFENKIIITIANKVTYVEEETNKQQQWNSTSNQKFFINKLLETSVIRAEVDKNKNLILELENKKKLIIESARDENESYIIYNADDFQVVY